MSYSIAMDCPDCSKTLYSSHALGQHCLAKHGKHICTECMKGFNSARSLKKHGRNVVMHSSGRSAGHSHDDPYDGIEGYWVSRDSFQGSKSFGWFECQDCSKTWFSAHAQKRYKQGCQECEEWTLPCCLWVNTGSNDNERRDRDDVPHDRARCQACKRGVCTVSR